MMSEHNLLCAHLVKYEKKKLFTMQNNPLGSNWRFLVDATNEWLNLCVFVFWNWQLIRVVRTSQLDLHGLNTEMEKSEMV